MKKKNLKKHVILYLMLALCSVLTACKQDTINFNHESNAQKLMHEYNIKQQSKPTVQKSSGVLIYKDNSTINNTSEHVNFGPKDLNFDMKF